MPGYAAWFFGFAVGILGHPWVGVLEGWHITSVYSLIVGFVVYFVLAKIGLEPKKVEVEGLMAESDAYEASEEKGAEPAG